MKVPKEIINPKDGSIIRGGRIEANKFIGKTIFKSPAKPANIQNRKEDKQIKEEKIRRLLKVSIDKEKIISYEPKLLFS